jgi:glutaredoxin
MGRSRKLLTAAVVALTLLPAASKAEIYKWTDTDGIVHFQDFPPPAGGTTDAPQILESREAPPPGEPGQAVSVEEPEVAPEAEPAEDEEEALLPPKVDLYTTSWCPQCEKARRYFRSRGVAFTEYDVEKDKNAARRWKRTYRARGVPLALINGERIFGYAPSRYNSALSDR